MESPRHTSLESQFRAAVPPPRPPLRQRLMWRVALRLLKLAFLQRLFAKSQRP
jgi:hypothetical protein